MSRGEFSSAHHHMVDLKLESNLSVVDIGCQPGPVCRPGASSELKAVA